MRRRQPYAQRWSWGVQRALPGQLLLELAYVGNRNTRLGLNRNLNFTPAQYLSTLAVRDQKTIDFLTTGRRGWRNVLPDNCPGLATERRFSFNGFLQPTSE